MNQYQHYHDTWTQLYALSLSFLIPPDDPVWLMFPHLSDDDKASWIGLSEMRTIHLGAGRQTGKTHWLVQMLKEHPSALLICRDKWERDRVICTEDNGGSSLYDRVFTMQDIRTLGIQNLLARMGTVSHLMADQGVCARQLAKTFDEVLDPSVIIVRMH